MMNKFLLVKMYEDLSDDTLMMIATSPSHERSGTLPLFILRIIDKLSGITLSDLQGMLDYYNISNHTVRDQLGKLLNMTIIRKEIRENNGQTLTVYRVIDKYKKFN